MSGAVVILVGLILCFLGVGSVHVATLASGFAVGWLIADALGATVGTALLIGLGGAVTAWIVAALIFRAAGFFVGAIVGGVIGSKLYTLLQGEDDASVTLAVVFVLAVAVVCGFLTDRFRARVLLWVCALGGAGLALSGLAEVAPSISAWVDAPETTAEGIVSGLLWLALALVGGAVQRRLFSTVLDRRRGGG